MSKSRGRHASQPVFPGLGESPEIPSGRFFLECASIKNYKSIEACSVRLKPLTILIGPNGAGKSNFLDALRFVADSMQGPLDGVLRERFGINEVRRKTHGHPTNLGIRLDFRLPKDVRGKFAFEIAAGKGGAFVIQREECVVHLRSQSMSYLVEKGRLRNGPSAALPKPPDDRFFLPIVSFLPGFREVFRALSGMGFYNLNPGEMKKMQTPDAGELLNRAGSNLPSVLERLSRQDDGAKASILEYLSKIVTDVQDVKTRHLGPSETIEFVQAASATPDRSLKFFAQNMSDGTLRALGVLTAIFQTRRGRSPATLIGIEEPETALHPGATGVLMDALRAASRQTQIVVTSHSADLLDDKDLDPDCLLSVSLDRGVTQILPINEEDRRAIQDRLFTAGELQRMNQLQPDPKAVKRARKEQLSLFDA